jgi:N-acetylmuramoyl-L-alanine amidase
MGKLQYLVIHCTATPEGREVSVEDIEKWHLEGRGWSRVGYSDLIQLDGKLLNLIPFDQDDNVDPWELSNGALGYNGKARHVVYSGGCANLTLSDGKRPAKDTRTPAQYVALATYVLYTVLRHPDIKVIGHNQISSKDCPSFDVPKWCKSIGLHSKNIGL